MKLSTTLPAANHPRDNARLAQDLEAAGIDALWVAEVYGFDAVSVAALVAARTERVQIGTGIAAIYSRTPSLTAMSAASLDAISEGRFVLGLGSSGPQVIEGWHGVPYDHPIGRTREIVDICRKVWRREPLVHQGRFYEIPLPPERGTGLGKPLKLINRPQRSDIPIYIAALGSKNLQLTAEIADGWIPHLFHPDRADVWQDDLDVGFRKRSADLGALEVVADVHVAFGAEADTQAALDHVRTRTALYVGGMGARGQNFYNDLFRRYGYEQEAETIQDHYLSGRREQAEAAVPEEFVQAVTLTGDAGRVRERVEAFAAAGVTCLDLDLDGVGPHAVRAVEQLRSWVS